MPEEERTYRIMVDPHDDHLRAIFEKQMRETGTCAPFPFPSFQVSGSSEEEAKREFFKNQDEYWEGEPYTEEEFIRCDRVDSRGNIMNTIEHLEHDLEKIFHKNVPINDGGVSDIFQFLQKRAEKQIRQGNIQAYELRRGQITKEHKVQRQAPVVFRVLIDNEWHNITKDINRPWEQRLDHYD